MLMGLMRIVLRRLLDLHVQLTVDSRDYVAVVHQALPGLVFGNCGRVLRSMRVASGPWLRRNCVVEINQISPPLSVRLAHGGLEVRFTKRLFVRDVEIPLLVRALVGECGHIGTCDEP